MISAQRRQDRAAFTRESAAKEIPKTNPFLRRLFKLVTDELEDEPYAGLVETQAKTMRFRDDNRRQRFLKSRLSLVDGSQVMVGVARGLEQTMILLLRGGLFLFG